ncbi:MAG TPA: peptidase, partial [Microvirga sp.]|nr:peptidase [Microvirga sp.]
MTYCVGILVRDGLVMIADTRTNAGVDNIAIFRKLHLFEVPGERIITLATAGNLSASQSVMSLLADGIEDPETGEVETLLTAPSMFKAAGLVGRAIRRVYAIDGAEMEKRSMSFDVTMLLGGQISQGPMRLYQIYSAGNAIEATLDTPFLQIGEPKYGKPILDRAIAHNTSLVEALKLGLISMDSTLKSNLGVGLPIDVV